MVTRNSILLVDDEPSIRKSLGAVLAEDGFKVTTVQSGEECLQILLKKSFELILLDIWLPGISGLETLEAIKKMGVDAVVVMISGHGTIETAVKATRLGAFDFIEKPFSIEKTLLVIKNGLENQRLQTENRNLKSAPTDGRVLVYGESGTGKELVAHALHNQSRRNESPFVEVNCAAIPEELIESELFGHLKGSFTGATSNKMGKLEKANGGTLFLDEVGDMSLKTQSKVLRALEAQRFEPVGGDSPISVDVRIIAATNKDLEQEMEKGNFREDLFYRLNVIPFFVPPLRERIEDVPALLEFFISDFSQLYGQSAKEITSEVVDRLTAYSWPGNVRELKNLAERLVIMISEKKIEPRHLPFSLLQSNEFSIRPTEPRSLSQARMDFDRDFILKKLEENQGNISRTAGILGIERSHLHRKLKSLKIHVKKRSLKKSDP